MLNVVLDSLVSTLGWVLVLEVGFARPSLDTEITEYIGSDLANDGLSVITEKSIHSSPFADIIPEAVDKILFLLDTIDIGNKGGLSHEKPGLDRSIVNSWAISIDKVGGDFLVATVDIRSWVR